MFENAKAAQINRAKGALAANFMMRREFAQWKLQATTNKKKRIAREVSSAYVKRLIGSKFLGLWLESLCLKRKS